MAGFGEFIETRRAEMGLAAIVYLVIFVMNVVGLPRVVCDMGNHVFVLMCLVFCVMGWHRHRDNLLFAFMVLTFLADVASGFEQTFAVGVVLFFASQIVMSFIIWNNNGGKRGWVLRAILIVAGLAGIAAAGLLSPLYAFGIVYFMWFTGNVIQAVAARDWDNLPVRVALVLYLIGDICLISNLLVTDAGFLSVLLTYGTWVPYLPAVFVIALSGAPAFGSSNQGW